VSTLDSQKCVKNPKEVLHSNVRKF